MTNHLSSLDPTSLGTTIHHDNKSTRDNPPQLIQLLRSQKRRIPQARREHIIRHGREKGLRNLKPSLIVAVKRGRKHSLLARRVELPVRVPLREQHAGVVAQRHGDLGDVADERPVRLEEKGPDEGAADHGQELVPAGVEVGDVEAAGADEADGCGDVGADQAWDGVDAADDDAAVLGGWAVAGDELEGDVVGAAAVVGGEEDLLLVLVRGGEE